MTVVLMVASRRGATNSLWRGEAGRTLASGIALASASALAAGAQLPRAPR
jgi:hypothetical protein